MFDDPQVAAVYDWENGWSDWNRETLTIPEIKAYVYSACDAFGVDYPTIRQHDGESATFSQTPLPTDDPMQPVIDFRRDHKNPAVALHEAAHHICTRLHPKVRHAHGPTWLGIYMALLVLAKIAPKDALVHSVRKRGLRFVWPKEKPPASEC